MKEHLPTWMQEWFGVLLPVAQLALIAALALLLSSLVRRLMARLGQHYGLPPEIALAARRVFSFLIWSGAVLLALDRLGVSATVLWTAFTGFATVGAVAFFAAWSVLSNIFCAVLIFTSRPFRIGDLVELLENGEKPGLKGRVVDVNLIYTTLQDASEGHAGARLQIPNSLFFQRTLRRWQEAPAAALPVAAPDKPV